MTQTTGVLQAMTNLNVAHRKLSLQPSGDAGFFTEWIEKRHDEGQAIDGINGKDEYRSLSSLLSALNRI